MNIETIWKGLGVTASILVGWSSIRHYYVTGVDRKFDKTEYDIREVRSDLRQGFSRIE
jgi:hypothetical protein